MSGYGNFVNQSSIDEEKEETRKARKLILEQAKKKYEADERKEKKRKERGEGTWMLDTVSKRIQKEERDIEDAKSKKKKKKKKKKHKKHSDSSASDSEEGETWVEAKTIGASNDPGKPLQRDSWMETPLDFLPMTSRQEIRDAANKEKETAKAEAQKHLQPGQHSRELNPYWKNGGTGVPSADPSSAESSKPSGATGDGGLSWLLKSLSRIKQQSQDEGRSVEEIAAERYGSLDRLMSMIRDVEKSRGRGGDGGRRDRQNDGNRDYRDRERERNRNRERDRNRGRDDDRDGEGKSHEKEDRRDREKLESQDTGGRRIGFQRPQSDDQEISDQYRKSSFDNGRKMFKRPGDDNDDEGDSKDRDRKSVTDERRKMFKRPGDDNDDRDRKDRDRKSVIDERPKMFKRPGDDEEEEERGGRGGYHRTFDKPRHRDGVDDKREGRDGREDWRKSSRREDERVPGWKKKDVESVNEDKEVERKKERSRKKSSSDSSSSSSEDEGQRSHSVNDEMSEEVTERVQETPKIMSEEELNDMAAKVFRAEIMGDESLVSELKAKLEEARTLREASKAGGGEAGDFVHSKMKEREGKRRKEEKEMEEGDDNVVVLSRTNKAGMTRPVLPSASDESIWGGRGAGKKRKKKNVTTHNETGDRTKFFDDDDSFDLKTLVEREKAGTAEDQNSMFARLAGREKDRDMDVDDIFVSKAARKQQEEDSINRDKMGAIMEHRQKSKAMDKCTRCFDKVPKHLIIAIGRKSYLCLPDHASMTEGHCFIVPMAHSSSATSMDEDVWQDMQLFRKSVVQMFLSQDKDVVVMETVMHLKYFPHTAIECIPLEKEVGDLAPIYFKKAMQEVGPEWSHNKKIHELSKKDIRHTVPKGFPYFSVDFGLQGGFAHVIEDEATFTSYFGREIVGGMLDVEPSLWRKPRKQNFEDQRQKVLQFEQWWSEFDWTQDLSQC